MKSKFLPIDLVLLLLISASVTFAQPSRDPNYQAPSKAEKYALLKSHNEAFQALSEKVRDPWVVLGPDGNYYLTGTTAGSHWGDTIGIRVWRSGDLVEWEDIGFVWDLYRDGKAADSWHFKQAIRHPEYKNPYAVWAPEIHYMNGTWWIPHCLNVSGHGLLRSTTGKPEGPYEALEPIGRSGIDAHLFKDNDGIVYYMYQADKLAPMNDEMTAITDEFITLEHDGNHEMGYEGILMLKFDDKYLFIASGRYGYEPTNTYDLYYAVSKDIRGPYGKRRMAVKNAGHGNLFQDKEGRWWSTAFDHSYTDIWSLWLVPIDIEVTENDILIDVKDERFRPTEEDQDFVKKLSIEGKPAAWEGKTPWYIPKEK